MRQILICALLLATALAVPRPLKRTVNHGRIVGGDPIDISKVPWQVVLNYYGSITCGGSILSENYVLTAAHCTDGSRAKELSVRAGTNTWDKGGQVVDVAQIFQHPKFDGWTFDYDISILKLKTPLTLNDNVQPAKLASASDTWDVGTDVLLTGYGTVKYGDQDLPPQLLGVTVGLYSLDQCNQFLDDSVTPRMFCAGVDEGGKDTCQGDSGGPVIINNLLAGITSWGDGCATRGRPGVYASVPALRDFITENTGL